MSVTGNWSRASARWAALGAAAAAKLGWNAMSPHPRMTVLQVRMKTSPHPRLPRSHTIPYKEPHRWFKYCMPVGLKVNTFLWNILLKYFFRAKSISHRHIYTQIVSTNSYKTLSANMLPKELRCWWRKRCYSTFTGKCIFSYFRFLSFMTRLS